MSHAVLAFYHLIAIENPPAEIARWKRDLAAMHARGRIYLSEGGINAQMSLPLERVDEFENWLKATDYTRDISIKVHLWHQHTFEKLIIKYRPQLVAFDQTLDLTRRGPHIKSAEFKAILEEGDPNTKILDVRNQYEYEIGHFEGALAPECDSFRDYTKFAERFCSSHDPKNTRVLMYCTGGIRCELFSSYLIEKGFEKVYQLSGGVIQYGLDHSHATASTTDSASNEVLAIDQAIQNKETTHWKGKLFVFDDRMAVPITDQPSTPISNCHSCQAASDDLYNCASADCNTLFVSCRACIAKSLGCCCSNCESSERLRPLEHQNPHRPFRKWHHYRDEVKAAS